MGTDHVTLNDTLEDLFGLSFRALTTVKTLFVRPSDYYAAAMVKDWGGRFTPSMRMWLSLFALLSLLQFIWLRTDGPLVTATAASISEAGIVLPIGMTVDQLSQRIYVAGYSAYPVLALIALTLGGMLFPFWGENHTKGTKIRSTFATLIPSTIVSVSILVLTVTLSTSQIIMFVWIPWLIDGLFDFTTAARGAFPESKTITRLLRALALAIWLGVINFGASIAAQVFGLAFLQIQTGVPLLFGG
ncbi:MAG: hypothetical protein AAF720_00070 [Pseudomonadota bacterium]